MSHSIIPLIWNGIYLAANNGLDAYTQTNGAKTKLDLREIVIPGTTGRSYRVIGKGQTDGSTERASFDVTTFFTSIANMNTWFESIGTKQSSPYTLVGSATYGLGSTTISITNCLMDFTYSTPRTCQATTSGYILFVKSSVNFIKIGV